MTLTIYLDGLPHCPRNRSHTLTMRSGRPMNIKTQVARAYEDAIKQELVSQMAGIKEFTCQFDNTKHCLVAEWTIYSPNTHTADGKISQNSTDLDAHKVLQDTIFEVVGIDDSYVVDDRRVKRQGEFKVVLILEIKPIKEY